MTTDNSSIPVQSIEIGDDCELQLRFYGKKGERLHLTWVLTPEVAAIPPQLTQPRAGSSGHRKTSKCPNRLSESLDNRCRVLSVRRAHHGRGHPFIFRKLLLPLPLLALVTEIVDRYRYVSIESLDPEWYVVKYTEDVAYPEGDKHLRVIHDC